MKQVKILAIFALLYANCFLVSARSLPDTAMGMPKIFLNEEMSWHWEEIAQKRDWGELSDHPWKVYIDKEDVKAFDKPSSSALVIQTCHFMDSYYVAEIKNGYALLFTQEVPSLKISSKAKACGWVSVGDLLLWHTCPRTVNQISRKVIIFKDSNIDETIPRFSKSPNCPVHNGFEPNLFEIYYVFKETSHSVLLFLGNSIDDCKMTNCHGWLSCGNYIRWDTRLCFEPNFEEDVAGLTAAIFEDKENANIYKYAGIGNNATIWKYELSTKRPDPRLMRFPVMDVDARFITKVSSFYKPSLDNFLDTVKGGYAIHVEGYTARISLGKEVFTTSVFMSKSELDMLIRSLESLISSNVENQRIELQKALRNIALIYIGQINDEMDLDALSVAVNEIGKAMGRNPLGGINIKMITDPNKVPQRIIDDLIEKLTEDAMRLREIEHDKSCYFTFNGERYYYILVDDMPLQRE